jgi:hypothetical protein
VDAVGFGGQRDVGAGVDEEGGRRLPTVSCQFLCFADCMHRFSRQGFQLACGKIFFAELDVVDAGAGSSGDFFQEVTPAGKFVSREGGAVGDVVEKAASWHLICSLMQRRICNDGQKQVPRLPSHSLRLRSE